MLLGGPSSSSAPMSTRSGTARSVSLQLSVPAWKIRGRRQAAACELQRQTQLSEHHAHLAWGRSIYLYLCTCGCGCAYSSVGFRQSLVVVH